MENRVLIFSASDEFQAIMLKGRLEEEGIETVLLNQKDSMYQFGTISLYVHETDALKARQIIHKYSEHGS